MDEENLVSVPTKTRTELWIDRAKSSTIALLAGVAGALLANATDLTDKLLKVTDRFGWTRSEGVLLAQDSAKSKFSEDLIRAAWRRLFYADLYTRRVVDATSVSLVSHEIVTDIEEAWKLYISSLSEWNANLMINIVGLEHYYDASKSLDLEGPIQSQFIALDKHLRDLRLTNFERKIRSDDQRNIIDTDRTEVKLVSDVIFWETSVQRKTLYFFVRCFSQDDRKRRTGSCDLPGFISETAEEMKGIR
jgi:hypothetical protein